MAVAKDLNEVYLCETDADRQRITPYAGQKCIMQNGDIYACFRAGVWGKIGEEPTPPVPPTPTGYTIPFEMPTSMCEDVDLGGDLSPTIIGQSAITNFENGNAYKFTLYDKNNVGYSVTSTASENEGFISADFNFDRTTLPEDIQVLFGTMSTATFTLVNNFSFVAGAGDYFSLYIITEEGKLSADVQAVITKFYIEQIS